VELVDLSHALVIIIIIIITSTYVVYMAVMVLSFLEETFKDAVVSDVVVEASPCLEAP